MSSLPGAEFSSSPIRLSRSPSPQPMTPPRREAVEDPPLYSQVSSPVQFTQTSPVNSPRRSSQPVVRATSHVNDRLARFAAAPITSTPAALSQTDDATSMAARLGQLDAAANAAIHGGGEAANGVIWGTDVDIEQVRGAFARFLDEYVDEESGARLYPELLAQILGSGATALNVSCRYLASFDESLYRRALEYPSEVLSLMDSVVYEKLRALQGDDEEALLARPSVRLFELDAVNPMRALNPTNIDQLVAVRGMVIRVSTIIPEMKRAFHRCVMCHTELISNVELGVVVAPDKCTNAQCGSSNCLELIHNRCSFTDKQLIKLQETPDAIPEGDTPHTIQLLAVGSLVDVARPGDRVEVTGLFRAMPMRASGRARNVKSIYRTYIDVVHFKKTDKKRMGAEDDLQPDELEPPAADAADDDDDQELRALLGDDAFFEGDETNSLRRQRENELRELAKEPDIYEKLVRSLAPSIWQLDDVKKGILCLLFGGTNKDFTARGLGRTRGDINILLCGDPGTSKSQLLSYVHKLAPRGIYTSGKGSSSVGLTAYITRDPDTGENVLESGALVLSDRGVCCIDEFDKMSDNTRAVLHEVMEQQTVSVAKAGIVATLNARTSILASANPVESRYNPNRSVVENLDLPPTLLSRFDLIYLVLDKANEDTDRRLARHLVQLYWDEVPPRDNVLPVEVMTRYISFARKTCHPKLSDEAAQMLVERYTQMRRLGASSRTVSATPRQLESMVRLSEALARMRLSDTVTAKDVTEAARLFSAAMQTAAIDPRTGRVDMDLIHTGRSAAQRTHMHELVGELKQLLRTRKTIRARQLQELIQQQASVQVNMDEMRDALRQLASEDFIALTGDPANENIRVLSGGAASEGIMKKRKHDERRQQQR